MSANVSNEQQLRLNKINEIKDYLLAEIREREVISKNLSKYIASFEFLSKSLIFLSVVNSSISIASFATVIGAPAEILGAICGLTFLNTSGLVKRFLKTTRNKKKKHNKTVMLARSKLNSTEGKISKALIDNEISHEDFESILNKEKKYWEMKESIRMMNSQRSEILKTYIQKFLKQLIIEQWYYQNVQYVVVKNQDLSKIKKQKDY